MEKMLNLATNKNQNGFESHDIKHMSPSSINEWRDSPDTFLAKKLKGARFPSNFAMEQGKAVELGTDMGVYSDTPIAECIKQALQYYKKAISMMSGAPENYEKVKPIIEKMVTNAIEQIRTIGKPKQPTLGEKQHKFELPFRFAEGELGKIPCMGYLDYWFPDQSIIVDLKTTSKAPSSWSISHATQASIYKKAMEIKTKRPVKVLFLYVLTRQKDPYVWLELEDPTEYIDLAKQTVRRLEAFLSLNSDSDKLLEAVPHNPTSFYWNNANDIRQNIFP